MIMNVFRVCVALGMCLNAHIKGGWSTEVGFVLYCYAIYVLGDASGCFLRYRRTGEWS